MSTYCDVLPAGQRKAHNASSLKQRALLLRPTARKKLVETIYFASPACFAWSLTDFTSMLTLFMERGATLIAVDGNLVISPKAGPRELGEAMRIFTSSKRTVTGLGAGAGAAISARKRRESTDDAVKRIADRWPLPSREYPTSDLLAEAGLSMNTVIDRLGRRPLAQKRRIDAAKRRARRQ